MISRGAAGVLSSVLVLGALDTPAISTRIAADVYGGPPGSLPVGITTAAGTSSDNDDNGLANDFYVPHITNVAAILAGGASPPAPTVREIGPLSYRSYSTIEQDCTGCGVANGVETWYDRKVIRFDKDNSATGFTDHSFGGPFDTTYVTVPNTNLRGLEAKLKTYSIGAIANFEALAIPLLGLQGVAQLMSPSALDYGLRALTFPLMLDAMYKYATSAPQSLVPSDFVSTAPSQTAIDSGWTLKTGGGAI